MELPPPDNSVLFEQKEAIYKLEKLIEELNPSRKKGSNDRRTRGN